MFLISYVTRFYAKSSFLSFKLVKNSYQKEGKKWSETFVMIFKRM